MRKLSEQELDKLKFLTSIEVEVTLIEPTANGLSKSIFDATQPIREFLKKNNVHDYESQGQGPEQKVVLKTKIITKEEIIETRTSLYRPNTKSGDPRIWFSGIGNYCKPNNIIALFYFDNLLWVFNLTTLGVHDGPIRDIMLSYKKQGSFIANELLTKLKFVASKGYIESTIEGDTAIGRLLEKELGIKMNSSRNPDYKGIEIKSYRSKRNNRKNLFAQVPNWELSKYKSSKEILDAFGYERGGIKKLYCTVNSNTYNPQGLRLRFEDKSGFIVEFSKQNETERALVWEIEVLQARLLEKHSETFWVEADVERREGKEWFHFIKTEHTRKPISTQLGILLNTGDITLDHLIKQIGLSAQEKGPLFKLKNTSLPLLFPPSETYNLI